MFGRYPKFLRGNPSFLGLNFIDLIILGIGLLISKTFEYSSIFGMAFVFVGIASHKIVSKYLDLTGLCLRLFKRSKVEWMDGYRGIKG